MRAERLIETTPIKPRKPQSAEQEEAHREVEAVLDPIRAGDWFSRGKYLAQWIWAVGFIIVGCLLIIALAYKGLQSSSKHLPEPLHLAILALYGLAVIPLVRWIATRRSRWERGERVEPCGLLILTGLILVVTAALFASITFLLYKHGLVSLEPCQGNEVSEERLLDFYIWHLLKLVPLLNINDVLKWPEPLCYSQARVGLLILLFQGSVVVPSIAAVRFYWENRHKFGGRKRAFVYEREWSPTGEMDGDLKDRNAT